MDVSYWKNDKRQCTSFKDLFGWKPRKAVWKKMLQELPKKLMIFAWLGNTEKYCLVGGLCVKILMWEDIDKVSMYLKSTVWD
jgi:hypothetical protein